MDEFDSIVEALEGSALRLDADPDSVVSSEFKERCRAALEQAVREPVRLRGLPVSRKIVALALAACLSGLIVVPALAGPGVGGTVDMFSNGVRHVFGPTVDRNAVLSDPNGPFASADATPGSALEATPIHPDNHGADVSEIAKATPEPGENHGEQVRQVARDNHGHDDATSTATSTSAATSTSTATSTATASATPTSTATATSTPPDDHHGSDQSGTANSTPDTNHGADVSDVAHSTPTADENHGQDVSAEAKDNHGQDEKATHGTATPTATPDTSSSPTPTPTEEPSSTHGGGNSQGGGDSHGGGNGHGR